MNKRDILWKLLRLFYFNTTSYFLKRQKNFKVKWNFNINICNTLTINEFYGLWHHFLHVINIQDYLKWCYFLKKLNRNFSDMWKGLWKAQKKKKWMLRKSRLDLDRTWKVLWQWCLSINYPFFEDLAWFQQCY